MITTTSSKVQIPRLVQPALHRHTKKKARRKPEAFGPMQIKLGEMGHDCSILAKGVDLAEYCTGIKVEGRAGELTKATLDLINVEASCAASLNKDALKQAAKALGYRLVRGTEEESKQLACEVGS